MTILIDNSTVNPFQAQIITLKKSLEKRIEELNKEDWYDDWEFGRIKGQVSAYEHVIEALDHALKVWGIKNDRINR